MRSRLKILIAEREAEVGRVIPISEIAEETSLSKNTLAKWARPTPMSQLDGRTASTLCHYLGVTIFELVDFGDMAKRA